MRIASFVAPVAILSLATAKLAGAGAVATTATPPPQNVSPPAVRGKAQVGQVLRASVGRWRSHTVRGAAYSFQWQRCDLASADCADVLLATDRVYPIRSGDAGSTLRVVVTATRADASASAFSPATKPVAQALTGAPLNTIQPTITGDARLGAVLTAHGGTWEGNQPIRLRYRWRRCTKLGGACRDLDRAGPTYTLRSQDVGHAFRVLVVAANAVTTSAGLSAPTLAVTGPPVAQAPTNSSPPTITGAAQQGKTLAASSGSWSGTAPITFSFQWARCGASGGHCSRIARATGQTYTLVRTDVGRTLRVRVTARNAAGSRSATSDHTEIVAGLSAPVNTSPPTVSGTAREGSVLSASTGTWRGGQPIHFSFRWQRCGSNGRSCVVLGGSSGQTRLLTSADVGHTMRVRVTATNAAGSSSLLSGPSALVASKGIAPASRVAPALSGLPRQGARLSLSAGSWTGTQPITYSYRWVRCGASLGDCHSIEGATGSTYVLTRADVGHRLYGVVTARNGAGSSSAASSATAVIVGAPMNTSLPTITGTPVEGQILTAHTGSWTGVGPISFGYQWTRCNAKGEFSSCVPIVVTSSSSYTLRRADVGHRIFVQVKAKNGYGASYVNSDLTAVVRAAPVGTVTIRATRSIVTYGHSLTLTGAAVGAQPGDRVTIVEHRVAAGVRVLRNVATITSNGTWRYVVRPAIQTTYRAEVRGRTSATLSIRVRPRLRLGKVGPGRLSLRVYAARSFAGRSAFLQQWNRKRHRWVSVRRIRLRATGIGLPPTVVSAATIRARGRRGTLVRVVLPSRNAGPGYLGGTSNRVRA
jgi:hypothetical protein